MKGLGCIATFQALKSHMLLMAAMLDGAKNKDLHHCVDVPLHGASLMRVILSFRLPEKAHV